MTVFEKRREVGRMLTSQREKMGMSNLEFEKYNHLPYCMSYSFESGHSLVGKYHESLKRMYSLNFEQIKALDELKVGTKGYRAMLVQMRDAGIKPIYMKVTRDKFQMPLYTGESIEELSLVCKCKLSNISKGISRFLSGHNSCYIVTIEPVCEDDEIEEQRLKSFYEGDVIECLKLTQKGRNLAKTNNL